MVVRILKGKSVRYQKAFNLNYHESKRHQDELAFLEITCSRNIHVIKQDIMRVKGWMDDVVKSTGHHVSHEIDKLTLSPPPSRQSSVNFSKVDTASSNDQTFQRVSTLSKTSTNVGRIGRRIEFQLPTNSTGTPLPLPSGTGNSQKRNRSGSVSLTAYQRRRQLQIMTRKARDPCEVKLDEMRRECEMINIKVKNYLNHQTLRSTTSVSLARSKSAPAGAIATVDTIGEHD